jgi:glycosyltransferase involved in cell wall biosynthesis
MKIGFDARMLTHPGIGRYIGCLLPEMIDQAPEDEFVLIGDPARLAKYALFEHVSVRKCEVPIYSAFEQMALPGAARGVDVLHVPHFNIPLLYKGRMVVTVHDLIYLLFPDSIAGPLGRIYAYQMIRAAVKRADRLITVSEHTRKDLGNIFGDGYSDKVKVIREAPGDMFADTGSKARQADVRTRYRLSSDIILYVGSVKPHKNVETLFRVFEALKMWGIPHQLVLCGRWDKKEDRLRKWLEAPDIRYLGEVPVEDLAALYNIASVLVHLSLYEGFGLTVLEAMRCGCPVVVSDRASLPEVAGEGAFVVDPLNVDQIADTVFNVLASKQLRQGMVDEGLEHAGRFSWKRTAAETLKTYREICS